jgi:metal-responsive CopG/Arc/MetJ family transcriptional regulator
MPSNRPLIQLRLEQPLYDKVTKQAKSEGRSRSNYVEDIVRRWIADQVKQKRGCAP